MAQVKTYRPNTVKITATNTVSNNGKSFVAATDKLSNWNRLIIFGTVQTSAGANITNAGIRVYLLAVSNSPLTNGALIATVFSDTYGEYGISLQTLTGTQNYAFEAYSPGN